MVNIENDSEGPYMQDFFGDVSTYVLVCAKIPKNTGLKGGGKRVGPVFFGFHY